LNHPFTNFTSVDTNTQSANFGRFTATAGARRVFLMVAALCSNLDTQVTTATRYGTVQDSSGAVLVGAAVTLSHSESGAVWKQATGATGEFTFEFLPIGPYTLSTETGGFRKLELSQIELGATQRLRRTFVLEVGSVSDTVTVIGGISLVNAVSPEQRESISELQVKELPLARRDISNIVALGAGIRLDSGGRGNGFAMRLRRGCGSGILAWSRSITAAIVCG
jgi:hypothetical protein